MLHIKNYNGNEEWDMNDRWEKYIKLMKERPELFCSSKMIEIVTDEKVVRDYEQETGKKIGVLYDSPYNILVVDLICSEKGTYYTYERILPAVERGAVVVMVICNGKVILLRQYRHSLREYQYGFPRGFGEEGVSPEDNVIKEVKEELNANAVSIRHLGELTPDSGILASTVSYYICEVESYEEKRGYEGIDSIVALDFAEFEEWVRDGKITDGHSIAAYGLYLLHSGT